MDDIDRAASAVNASGAAPPSAADSVQFATSVLAFYITGFLSILGIIGNVLSVFVLQRANRHRRCPLFTILSALCLIDAVFILGNFFINVLTVFYEYYQIPSQQLYFWYLSRGYVVKYVLPVCFTTQMASIYITLLVSFERFNAVCRPLSVANCKPAGRAVCRNICLVLLLSVAYNVPKYFEQTVKEIPLGGDLQQEWKRQQLVSNSRRLFGCYWARPGNGSSRPCELVIFSQDAADWLRRPDNSTATGPYEVAYTGVLYALFYFLIPVTAISYMNIRIAKSLRRSINMWQVTRRQEKEAQLTYVSLAIVISFYLFMLPNVLLTIIESVARPSDNYPQQMQLIIVATNFLVLINSCLNFILYCVIGKKFRQSLRDLLCWPCDACRASRHRRRSRASSAGLTSGAELAPMSRPVARRSKKQPKRRCSSCADQEVLTSDAAAAATAAATATTDGSFN